MPKAAGVSMMIMNEVAIVCMYVCMHSLCVKRGTSKMPKLSSRRCGSTMSMKSLLYCMYCIIAHNS